MEEKSSLNETSLRQVLISIHSNEDIVTARSRCREISSALGFAEIDQTVIATAVSEIARNIVEYAKRGEIFIRMIKQMKKTGILIIARDLGPGIPDITKAMQDGYTTGSGMGVGLPGARRLMDEFEIESEIGRGTTVTMKKWKI